MRTAADTVWDLEGTSVNRLKRLRGIRREDQAPSHLGYSVDRREDGVLVVSTTEIDHPYMDDVGTPMSGAAEIVERFQMSDDETRLDWSATVVDPETFTEPVALPVVHFEWWPQTRITPYNRTVYPG